MRRLIAILATTAAALGLSGYPVPVSAATPSWQVTSTPFDAPQQGALACATTTFCVAANQNTWLRWNGSRWSSMLGPVTGVPNGYIPSASACPSTTNCITVGNYQNSLNSAWSSYAARWNGRYWGYVALPTLTAPNLRDVACPATNSCYAVGDDNLQQLVLAWDGNTWKTVDDLPAAPAGAEYSQLLGISCWGPDGCIVLGYWWNTHTQNNGTYAEEWNGTTWSTMPQPTGTSATVFLDQLSCPTAAYCLAVGQGPMQIWDGSTWSVVSSTPPSQAIAVDCAAVGDCMVDSAGAYTTDNSGNMTVQSLGTMLHFDGSTLTAFPRPAEESTEQGLLGALDCVRSTYCVATGLRPGNSEQPEAMFAEVYS